MGEEFTVPALELSERGRAWVGMSAIGKADHKHLQGNPEVKILWRVLTKGGLQGFTMGFRII